MQRKTVKVPLQYTENIWTDIPVDEALSQALREGAFTSNGDGRHILRWLLEKGIAKGRCALGWYPATLQGIRYISSRTNSPEELVAITTAIFSSRTAVDLNMLATQLWDLGVEDALLYGTVRTDVLQDNLNKFIRMRDRWNDFKNWEVWKQHNLEERDIAKIWLFALTRPTWRDMMADELGIVIDDETAEGVQKLVKPILMYGKTGNFALNLMGYTGVITVDTHMFKPIFGLNRLDDEIGKILHSEDLYQHFAEDYTDLLEELATEMDFGGRVGMDYSPVGLQALVWVMRQKANQDLTLPIGLRYFPRLREALANRPQYIDRLITALESMKGNPKITIKYKPDTPLANEVQSLKTQWQKAIEEEWITPLKQLKQEVESGTYKSDTRVRRNIATIREEATEETATSLYEKVPSFFGELHRLKTEGKAGLGGFEAQLKTGLGALAKAIQSGEDMVAVVEAIGRSAKDFQSWVHLRQDGAKGEKAKATFQQGKEKITNLLRQVSRYQQTNPLDIPIDLFLKVKGTGDNPSITLHSFWRRFLKNATLKREGNYITITLTTTEDETIPLILNMTNKP